jgi:hypothetical protein
MQTPSGSALRAVPHPQLRPPGLALLGRAEARWGSAANHERLAPPKGEPLIGRAERATGYSETWYGRRPLNVTLVTVSG